MIKRNYTVIITDDDPDDRFIAEKAFKELGFPGNLSFAQDGEELLNYLNQFSPSRDIHTFLPPSFILLDLNMPLKDGWQILREIKDSRQLKDIPVIIWTTSNNNEDKLRSIKMGADDFLVKPGHFTGLLQSFQHLIEKYCKDGAAIKNN